MDLETQPYSIEIPKNYSSEAQLVSNRNWINHTKSLIEMSTEALKNDKRVVLIQFPHRHEVYFNTKELGVSKINFINYYVELELLRNSLPKEVLILDVFPFLKEYWTLNNEYLYFKKDGHFNEVGNKLVAEFLAQNLK